MEHMKHKLHPEEMNGYLLITAAEEHKAWCDPLEGFGSSLAAANLWEGNDTAHGDGRVFPACKEQWCPQRETDALQRIMFFKPCRPHSATQLPWLLSMVWFSMAGSCSRRRKSLRSSSPGKKQIRVFKVSTSWLQEDFFYIAHGKAPQGGKQKPSKVNCVAHRKAQAAKAEISLTGADLWVHGLTLQLHPSCLHSSNTATWTRVRVVLGTAAIRDVRIKIPFKWSIWTMWRVLELFSLIVL